jgi:FixJ family two-component response regulator
MEWNSLMDFLEKTIKEQELLNISYKQSKQNKADRQTKEGKKTESERLQDELEPLPWCPMSDE